MLGESMAYFVATSFEDNIRGYTYIAQVLRKTLQHSHGKLRYLKRKPRENLSNNMRVGWILHGYRKEKYY